MLYFIINLERQKLKLLKKKQSFCNADADVSADADTDISQMVLRNYSNYKNLGIGNWVSIILRIFLAF